ncbi:TlpA family protein disulfide reductase [Pedobacter africanus]|uniref:Peroxiredoxin n=1 Tax=Pedobacter africanus TaxID=151894 RepID=A0A1W2DB05_9SPHI|nr:TlpA disulfide reductase family protein [Pedobacter africanus]SMC94198.1 Peroxiredoxin [Pedobacter africanus]
MSVNLMKLVGIVLIGIGLQVQAYAASQAIPADTAIVRIKSKDTTNYPVRLMYSLNNESKFVLNAKPIKGIYEFRLPLNGYSKAVLYITSASNIIKSGKSFVPQPAPQFLIKGGTDVTVTADFNNPLDLSLKASDAEIRLYESYAVKERQTHQQIWARMKIKFAQPDQQEKQQQAEAEIASLSAGLKAFKKQFTAQHRNTFSALMVFESYYTELGNEQAFKQLKLTATAFKDSPEWKTLYAKLYAANATAKGAVIPAFEVQDINGQTFNSRKLEGKYLLIDFWGSWCQPCRASHPELKAIYEQYKPKGLEILGIAFESGTMENQLKQWKKAIAEDQINWVQVLNTTENNLVKLFGVSSYPTKILVDPKGNILLRTSGHSDELKKLLETIFGSKTSGPVSLNKSVGRDSLLNYLNQKLTENTTQSKAILKEEAGALVQSATEENLLLALKLYKAMGSADAAAAVEKGMLKKYPRGVMARDLAYDKIFGIKPEPPLAAVEKSYLNWLKTYPAAAYGVKQQERYNFALLTLVQRFSKAGNKEKTEQYLELLKDSNMKTVALYNVGKDLLDRNEVPAAAQYLGPALKLSKEAKMSADPKMRKGFAAMYYSSIVEMYSSAMLLAGQANEAIKLTADLLEEYNYTGMNCQQLVLTLAKARVGKGEKLYAFLALDRYLRENPQTPPVLEMAKDLYVMLNGSKAEFEEYLNSLLAGKQKQLTDHLKTTMIREKAPLFSLYNRKGQLVNLADYKGKVVVLDFWATWCVPCVQSFPGMQATIDQYKNNRDVEFLFINTWETKAGFEKNVDELMDQHHYTFNVLYDRQANDNKELAVKQYGVKAIPAKFVIDKEGNIRFRVSNSRTDKASILSELSAMIDIVLKQ